MAAAAVAAEVEFGGNPVQGLLAKLGFSPGHYSDVVIVILGKVDCRAGGGGCHCGGIVLWLILGRVAQTKEK